MTRGWKVCILSCEDFEELRTFGNASENGQNFISRVRPSAPEVKLCLHYEDFEKFEDFKVTGFATDWVTSGWFPRIFIDLTKPW